MTRKVSMISSIVINRWNDISGDSDSENEESSSDHESDK